MPSLRAGRDGVVSPKGSPRGVGIMVVMLALLPVGCQLPPRQIVTTQAVQSPPELHGQQRLLEMTKVADVARQSGNFPNAVELYRKAIAQGVDTLEIHLDLAEALLGSGDITGSITEYKLVETRAPTDVRPEIGLGRLNLIRRQPALALGAYERALSLAPGNLAAINGRGVALDLLGRHVDAQNVYRQGLIANPDDRTLRNNLGLSLVFTRNYGEAVSILTALAQEPGATPRNRQNLALALGMQGDNSDAKMVAAHDLDDDSVQNNLRYYDYMRGLPSPPQMEHLLPPAAAKP